MTSYIGFKGPKFFKKKNENAYTFYFTDYTSWAWKLNFQKKNKKIIYKSFYTILYWKKC